MHTPRPLAVPVSIIVCTVCSLIIAGFAAPARAEDLSPDALCEHGFALAANNTQDLAVCTAMVEQLRAELGATRWEAFARCTLAATSEDAIAVCTDQAYASDTASPQAGASDDTSSVCAHIATIVNDEQVKDLAKCMDVMKMFQGQIGTDGWAQLAPCALASKSEADLEACLEAAMAARMPIATASVVLNDDARRICEHAGAITGDTSSDDTKVCGEALSAMKAELGGAKWTAFSSCALDAGSEAELEVCVKAALE